MIDKMKVGRILRNLLIISVLSTFVFCTISFLSIVVQLHPIAERLSPELEIGYPYSYYREFYLRGGQVNFSWDAKCFLIDFGLVWGLIFLIFVLKDKIFSLKIS